MLKLGNLENSAISFMFEGKGEDKIKKSFQISDLGSFGLQCHSPRQGT